MSNSVRTEVGARRVPTVRRPRRVRVSSNLVLGVCGVMITLVAWQVASLVQVLPDSTIPSATSVFSHYAELGVDPEFWASLGATVSSWILGCFLASIIAFPLGLFIGSSRFADESSTVLVEFLKPIPPIALIPLGLLLWGPSPTMKLTLITFGALWPLMTQVIYGVRAVDQLAVTMARSYRLGPFQTLAKVVLPGILPYALTGLRLSAAIALMVTIVVEMVGGVPGIGQDILQAQNGNSLSRMYALIILSGLLGLIVNGAFQLLERRVLRWHPSQRREIQA